MHMQRSRRRTSTIKRCTAALCAVTLLGAGAWLGLACSSTTTPSVPPATDAAADALPDVVTLPPPVDAGVGDATVDSGCVADPGAGDAGIDLAGGDGGDPVGGDAGAFTLTQAMAGFPASPGVLTARIDTELGQIVCRLDEAAAPASVANFVGLARGTRPYLKGTAWTVGKFYDGLTWHRVIPNFVIQGGDPRGTGSGGPGYSLPNENHVAQDKGVLSMAASNPTPTDFLPSGSQFYIVVGRGPKDDYNVFGSCSLEAATAIAAVDRRPNDSPQVPIHMNVRIERCPR